MANVDQNAIGLKQADLAALLDVPLETFRTWDSGRRPLPQKILHLAKKVVADWRRDKTGSVSIEFLVWTTDCTMLHCPRLSQSDP